MEFADVDPNDLPSPPTVNQAARRFGMPLITFAPTDHLEELGVATMAHGDLLVSVALTFTLWRRPEDRDDPANLADLAPEVRASLDAPPIRPLPERMLALRDRMRFPMVWEAVRTTRAGETSLEHTLLEHVHYVAMNVFREERVRGAFPGELTGRATPAAIEHGIPILLDGAHLPGIRIDTDPHVLGLALDLGDRLLTVAISRDDLPYVPLEFVTRPRPKEHGAAAGSNR